MTEDDIRRIIREEIRAAFPDKMKVGSLGQIVPVPLPMPPYHYQDPTPNTCVYGGHASAIRGVTVK